MENSKARSRSWLHRLSLQMGGSLWRLVAGLIPKSGRHIVINTFPDFDDTTRALLGAAQNLGYYVTILTTRREAVVPPWAHSRQVWIKRRWSLSGMWAYHRARYVFYTHGCFSLWPLSPRQLVVNLWHGMPIKNIGLLDDKRPEELPRFHYTIASTPFFRRVMARAFGVPKNRVLLADHPRTDALRMPSSIANLNLPDHNALAVWLPTYRAAHLGETRSDGAVSGDPFAGELDISLLDEYFHSRGILCLVKPHPMAKADSGAFRHFRALMYIDEDTLQSADLTLYQLLSAAHFLITDVSSVQLDFASTGKPTLVFFPDIDAYATNRGFTAPIRTLLPQPIITDLGHLCSQIDHLLSGQIAMSHSRPLEHSAWPGTLHLFEMLGMSHSVGRSTSAREH